MAGYALQFDGNTDLVRLAKTEATMGTQSWTTTKTISLWVKPAGVGQDCENDDVSFCDHIFGDRPRWWGISRGVVGGKDRIWVWNYSAGYAMIGIPYTPDGWVHISLVHSNGLLLAYKNGELVGSVPSGPTWQSGPEEPGVLYLGGVITSIYRNWTFTGQIDEVEVWNIARSGAEIQASMYQALNGNEPGLAAYYRMSDGSGNVLSDDGQFGWDGILIDGGPETPPDGTIPLWVLSEAY